MIDCSVGVTAHNEERNIGRLLERLLAQELRGVRIAEIIVVAGGCTDSTEEIVRGIASREPRVRLIREPERRGKAAAINLFLAESKCGVCAVICADTLPAPDSLEKLVAPLADPRAGMTGARVVPLNLKNTFPGYLVHFLWNLHHEVALRQPKCGEMVAFRRVFAALPEDTVVDEPQIEALVRAAGYDVLYAPDAVVRNLGPDNLREILMRRSSIVAGYIRLAWRTDYRTSSQRHHWWLLRLVFGRILRGEEPALYAFGAMAVELAARVIGWWNAKFSKKPLHLWPPAASTKSPGDCEMK
jgi:cellulose synthase/poly-beta-1,6-N-acetylglucosamine synthase-like glycosyltransferase